MNEGNRIFNIKGNYIEKQEITVENGGTLNFGNTEPKNNSASDEKLKEVLEELFELQNENGKKVFNEQGQWYAVFRVLSKTYNYPKNMSEFCRLMENVGFDKCAIPCKAESVRKIQSQLPKLSCRVSTWNEYINLSEAYRKQIDIANFLLKRLK